MATSLTSDSTIARWPPPPLRDRPAPPGPRAASGPRNPAPTATSPVTRNASYAIGANAPIATWLVLAAVGGELGKQRRPRDPDLGAELPDPAPPRSGGRGSASAPSLHQAASASSRGGCRARRDRAESAWSVRRRAAAGAESAAASESKNAPDRVGRGESPPPCPRARPRGSGTTARRRRPRRRAPGAGDHKTPDHRASSAGRRTAAPARPRVQRSASPRMTAKKSGMKKMPTRRREEHSGEHAGAERVPAGGAGAARDDQRRHAEDERERGHENRPEPLARRLDRRLADATVPGAAARWRTRRSGSRSSPRVRRR